MVFHFGSWTMEYAEWLNFGSWWLYSIRKTWYCKIKYKTGSHWSFHDDFTSVSRNCLVGKAYHIKISDFGTDNELYSSDYYKADGNMPLPVRWMAWESIFQVIFGSLSEVYLRGNTLFTMICVYCRVNTRRKATFGRSPLLCGRYWTLEDEFRTSIWATKKWWRVWAACKILPLRNRSNLMITKNRKRLLLIFNDRMPHRKTSTIWCWSAGDVTKTRDQLFARYRYFYSEKTSATLRHPDINLIPASDLRSSEDS